MVMEEILVQYLELVLHLRLLEHLTLLLVVVFHQQRLYVGLEVTPR